jgi:N6-L-threonylcarbamoyladenine synthase
MRLLAIETSCDETAIAIVEAEGDASHASFRVLGNALLSQIELHKPYGGVFPSLAKREHAKNLVPILEAALEEAEMLHEDTQAIPEEIRNHIAVLLEREHGLAEAFFDFVSECEPPAVDAIAVTAGPGLEPALWVGINFAKALALLWNKPLVAVNHMEGHIMTALAKEPIDTAPSGTRFNLVIEEVQMPVLALLISGGHTELVLMNEWLQYELVGQTRDDAVGEAFDKVARMLDLPYPGSPEISKLAEQHRSDRSRLGTLSEGGEDQSGVAVKLPRPMIDSLTCDFSFAGLKTAVMTLLKKMPSVSEHDKKHIAHEFENAVADVLWKKALLALEQTQAKILVIGGGVSANTHIRRVFAEKMNKEFPDRTLRIPTASLTTDNAIMIALAGYYHALNQDFADPTTLTANGNLSLAKA